MSGSQLILSCNATGDPIPFIEWRRNGRVYTNSENVRVTSQSIVMLNLAVSSLTVSSITPDDIGVYECVAINVLGIVSKNITVILAGNAYESTYIVIIGIMCILMCGKFQQIKVCRIARLHNYAIQL